ncbi:MAG: hypothetical protein Q9165_008874 [Trypethelium subeluteriae]
MSARFPALPSGSSSALNDLDAQIERHHGVNTNFVYKDSNGNPIGPFSILAYTPDLFKPFMDFGEALLHQPGLTSRMRELAILAVTAAYPTPFVAYAHVRIAEKIDPPLTPEQTDAACKGILPPGLQDKEATAYKVSLIMARGVGTLPEEEWKSAESLLGKESVARIAHFVGFYLYACSLMRMGEVGLPDSD